MKRGRHGMQAMEFHGEKVLVFGAGKSGIGSCDLLGQMGASVILYDGNASLDKDETRQKAGEGYPLDIVTGELPEEYLSSVSLVIMSPGVPTDLPLVSRFRALGIPVWGEVELAYRAGKGRLMAITGTNGKTTTTALLGKIMGDYYPSVFVVGNIGTPYTSMALKMREDSVTVAEISSFQLETIQTFAPEVSAILNITEDHLNRHHTMEEYIRVKELITLNQGPEQTCVLNYEDEVLRDFGQKTKARVIYFSSLRRLPEGIFLEGDTIILKTATQEIPIIRTDELKILGRHNHENVMAAAAMAYAAGVPVESLRKSIAEFTAVPHRIEFVREVNGVAYYNDSKGTNPDAAIKGIQAMNRPTYLIGGGYDKGSSYDEWINAFDGKVKALVLIGQTREKIRDAALRLGFTNVFLCDNLKEAVLKCHDMARENEAVLLSPACASWGQFDNYEQRGDLFKEYVKEL